MNPADQGPAELRAPDGQFVDGLLDLDEGCWMS
jgi:hypothetical protein